MKPSKNILKKYKISPNKRLGQNFLIDKKVLSKMIEAANLSPDDIVLEVGPGLGVLTLELAKRAKKVIAVEKDKKMAEILENILMENNINNTEIVENDILKIDWKLEIGNWKLIANIPYYLTSPLIRKFLESENSPSFMLLMVQKEVAQRICSKPPKMNLLSIAVQFYAEPKIISYVSKKSFSPQPKIDSAIIKITPRDAPSVIAIRRLAKKQSPDTITGLPRPAKARLAMTIELRDHFFRLVKAAFSQPRKQLVNNLSKGLNLSRCETEKILWQCGIKPTQRPSELSVDKYMEMAWITSGK